MWVPRFVQSVSPFSFQVPISPDPDGQITGNMSMDCFRTNGGQNMSTQIHEELTGKDASWILTTAVIIFTMQTGITFTMQTGITFTMQTGITFTIDANCWYTLTKFTIIIVGTIR